MRINQLGTPASRAGRLGRVAAWAAVGVSAFYALFAAGSAIQVADGWLASRFDGPERAAPAFFVLHGLAGAVALLAGAIQLVTTRQPLGRSVARHRFLGRAYAAGAWLTAGGGLVVTAAFDVGLAAKAVFAAWALAWMGTTATAVYAARLRRFGPHRKWMVRSYALALVFATFSVMHPAIESVGAARTAAYAGAMALSVVVNLGVAEAWVWRARTRIERAAAMSTVPVIDGPEL